MAAGLLLGSAIQVSRTRTGRAAGLAVVIGAVTGILVAPMLAGLRAGLPTDNRRYADYIPSPSVWLVGDSTLVDLGACLLAVFAVAALVAGRMRAWRDEITTPSRAGIVGAAGIVLVGVLTHWWFLRFLSDTVTDTETTGLHTFDGGYVAVGIVLVLAVGLRGPGRLLWVAAAASVVAIAADGTTTSGATVALVTAVLVTVAAALTVVVIRRSPPADRARGVPIAVAILTACTATQFITDGFWSATPALVGAFGVPVVLTIAVAAAVVSTEPDQAVVVGAVGVLTLLPSSTGTDFGWTSYTPLSDGPAFDGITGETPATSQTVVAVLILVACCVAAIAVARRSDGDGSVLGLDDGA
ncbi:hypothetical protein ACXVUM_06985 [Williamsia sp. SKLECPSW1]